MKSLSFLPLFIQWSPSSWQNYPVKQIPEYEDKVRLQEMKQQLQNKNPLIFAGEIKSLRSQLKLVEEGKQFIFQ